ncbi:MAG: hypothetical protein KGD73_02590 [Candidatus Lokiarchaeota archaeon]|nr:hypothetical protein [Candidatus Lokiarchaeota archaeon]
MTEEDPIDEIEEKKPKKPKEKARAVPAKTKKPKKKAAAKAEPEADTSKTVHMNILVNFWRTRLHDEELGIHQQLKYQAKTRWYSKNFDMEGIIEIDGEKKYVIAFNKEEWEEKPLTDKRIVCRFFTIMEETMDSLPKGGGFKGGVELSIAHSIIQSYEIKHAAPVFFFQVPGIINLIRINRGWRFLGSRWTFPLLPEDKDDQLQMVHCKGVVGPGRNYKIYIGNVLIARVDGHPIQKEYEIEIYNKDYAKDKTFRNYMILFGITCGFMDESKKIIKYYYKKMKSSGTSEYKVPRTELMLFRNPRMMRR